MNLPKRVGDNDRCGDTNRCGDAERAGDAERVGEKRLLSRDDRIDPVYVGVPLPLRRKRAVALCASILTLRVRVVRRHYYVLVANYLTLRVRVVRSRMYKFRLLVHFWTAHRGNHLPHAAHLRAALQRVIRTALRVRV